MYVKLAGLSSDHLTLFSIGLRGRDGPWPDPTRAYFWPAVNKRPTRLWPGYFPTQPKAIFFEPKGKNWKIWRFRGNFLKSNPNHKWLTQPNPTQATKNWPDTTWVKNFWPGPISTLGWGLPYLSPARNSPWEKGKGRITWFKCYLGTICFVLSQLRRQVKIPNYWEHLSTPKPKTTKTNANSNRIPLGFYRKIQLSFYISNSSHNFKAKNSL